VPERVREFVRARHKREKKTGGLTPAARQAVNCAAD
jgi:hypothetical protein